MSATLTEQPSLSASKIPLREVQQIVGPVNVLTKQEDIIPYSFDGTAAIAQLPGCVLFVQNAEQVSAILKLANRGGLDVVTRGSGTGLSGGSVPSPNCIVMCTVRIIQPASESERGRVTGTPVGCACGDGVIDWRRVIEICSQAKREIVFSVECGTVEQAERSIAHLRSSLKPLGEI